MLSTICKCKDLQRTISAYIKCQDVQHTISAFIKCQDVQHARGMWGVGYAESRWKLNHCIYIYLFYREDIYPVCNWPSTCMFCEPVWWNILWSNFVSFGILTMIKQLMSNGSGLPVFSAARPRLLLFGSLSLSLPPSPLRYLMGQITQPSLVLFGYHY